MVSLPRERDNVVFDDERLLEVGRRVLRMEAEEIARAAARVGRELVEAARIISRCEGRLVVVGMGKSGLVGRKIAATLASLGTPAFFSSTPRRAPTATWEWCAARTRAFS